MVLLDKLIDEKNVGHRGGIYNKLQVDFAYNSNHIEGSRLTHDQTRYIYETKTVGIGINKTEAVVRVNDVIETVNHFRCFDFILDTISQPIDESYIKQLHSILKTGVMDNSAVVGEYKKEANYVGDLTTVKPENVSESMKKLLLEYDRYNLSLFDIAEFHMKYERIHPFYDGNGRTGRLLMFKQCLANDILPFIIDDNDKMFYYMGLKEWQTEDKNERLINVLLASQDNMAAALDYFSIDYNRGADNYKDVIQCFKSDNNLLDLTEKHNNRS